jgi:hypothetical protein
VALISALFSTPEINLRLQVVEGSYIHSNRTQLAKLALDQQMDYMFFMDHDVVFPADTLCRLLSHNKDIVFGKYSRRETEPKSLVMGLDGKLVTDFPSGLFPCASGPAGCMLIKMSVFANLPKPWFHVVVNDDGSVSESEDSWFCAQAHSVGLSVWCDPSIKVDHYGEAVY